MKSLAQCMAHSQCSVANHWYPWFLVPHSFPIHSLSGLGVGSGVSKSQVILGTADVLLPSGAHRPGRRDTNPKTTPMRMQLQREERGGQQDSPGGGPTKQRPGQLPDKGTPEMRCDVWGPRVRRPCGQRAQRRPGEEKGREPVWRGWGEVVGRSETPREWGAFLIFLP